MPPKRTRSSGNKGKSSRAKKQKIEGRSRVKPVAQVHPNWCQLPPEMQNLVVSKMDNETKRALRATSLHNFHVVNNFQFMNLKIKYFCYLGKRVSEDGTTKFTMGQLFDRELPRVRETKYEDFKTLEARAEHLRMTLNKFDTFKTFGLSIKGLTEPFPLLKNQRKIKAEVLDFNVANEPNVVNGFLSQFDQDTIRGFKVSGENIREEVFGFFELHWFRATETIFVNDSRLLSIRAKCVCVPGNYVTFHGLIHFLNKMLRNGGMQRFVLTGLSRELTFLFHYSRRVRTAQFFIKPRRSASQSVSLELSRIPRKPLRLEGKIVPREEGQDNHPNRVGPVLQWVFNTVEIAP